MPTPFVADAADEAVRSESILNERKAADIIEETALEVDIRAWRAEGLRLLQAASAREDKVPNGARRPCSVPSTRTILWHSWRPCRSIRTAAGDMPQRPYAFGSAGCRLGSPNRFAVISRCIHQQSLISRSSVNKVHGISRRKKAASMR